MTERLDQIMCRACTPESRETRGCSRCGGYGIVLVRRACAKCHTLVWLSPGVTTVYDGKKVCSFEGLPMVWNDGLLTCADCCPEKPNTAP